MQGIPFINLPWNTSTDGNKNNNTVKSLASADSGGFRLGRWHSPS